MAWFGIRQKPCWKQQGFFMPVMGAINPKD
jgi:hypothetical protein